MVLNTTQKAMIVFSHVDRILNLDAAEKLGVHPRGVGKDMKRAGFVASKVRIKRQSGHSYSVVEWRRPT